MDLKVLYEDNHLIAVYKPAGILVQEDKTGDSSLLDQVRYYLKNKYHKPGKVFLGLIHRLDRPVSGIIIFGKTSKGAARLSEQFREHTVEKIYHAVVCGKPEKAKQTIIHHIVKDENKNKVKIYDSPTKDSKDAELTYEVVKSNSKYSLLKIWLGTGRSHQIRAQLSAIGHPIVGDIKYGAPEPLPDKSLALSATSLAFVTATGEESIKLESQIPDQWLEIIK
ncbi:MAG: RNA pseudouridine synthase [Patescibacteria group bacterium]|jgi:23S rRNA pseudouridine1911/1915/1917 synthase